MSEHITVTFTDLDQLASLLHKLADFDQSLYWSEDDLSLFRIPREKRARYCLTEGARESWRDQARRFLELLTRDNEGSNRST